MLLGPFIDLQKANALRKRHAGHGNRELIRSVVYALMFAGCSAGRAVPFVVASIFADGLESGNQLAMIGRISPENPFNIGYYL